LSLRSGIEWTCSTWNPVTGCSKVSLGCQHCYAERIALRLKGQGTPKYRNGFKLTLHPDVVEEPLSWRKPRRVFVCSMGDLFHEDVPFEFIEQIFDVARKGNWHQFQILTKRSERLLELSPRLSWPPNVWMGVTVETADYLPRIAHLRGTDASVKFLSLEPLLGPMPNLDLAGIDWVIVGGESGPKARPMAPEWARSVRAQCLRAEVPFFFKQWGGVYRKREGRLLDGRTWDEMPRVTQTRDMRLET
jgi:protein gp37